MAAKSFSFRLNAEGAEQVVGAFRQVAGQSEELRRAYEKLIASSPQLASVHDGVKAKLNDAADAMRKTGTESTALAGSLGRAGAMGLAIGAGTQLFETFVEKVKEAYAAIPLAGDAAKQAVARFTALGGSADIAAQSYEKLQAIARATGAPLKETADSFAQFSIAAKDLGASSEQVLRVVEGVQKFGVVSGASPQAMAAATQQLGQALASGKLQGDELRSIIENLPLLAQALAKELGTSVGQMRQLGSEGKLNGVEVFQALERAAGSIDEKFRNVPMSLERAGNAASTATGQLLAQVDKLLGLSTGIADKWAKIAGWMDSARQFLGGATAAETAASLEVERQSLEAERSRLQADRELAGRAGIGQIGGLEASQRTRQIEERLAAIRQQQQEAARDARELRAMDREAALQSGREGARANLVAARDKLLEMDPGFKARKERDEDLKNLKLVFEQLGLTAEEYDRTAKAIEDKYTKAVQKSGEAEKDAGDATMKLLEARQKITDNARAVELALDPQAAAWAKTADQVQKLIDAMQLYEDSFGAQGMAPERAQELIARAQENLSENWERLANGAEKANSSFDRFFSNATSRFEDAIVRGGQLRDVINGIAEDIARLIIRSTITNPLADAASGLLKGGFSSLMGGFKDFFSSSAAPAPMAPGVSSLGATFANGGIMTSAGPVPLRTYAGGGVADSPQLALFGEGATPEAYVPLPDGRSIPVTMHGQGASIRAGDVIVNVSNSNASPQQIAAVVQAAVERSHRELLEQVNRGGAMAKALGRRR